jgi:hypothetical protein
MCNKKTSYNLIGLCIILSYYKIKIENLNIINNTLNLTNTVPTKNYFGYILIPNSYLLSPISIRLIPLFELIDRTIFG